MASIDDRLSQGTSDPSGMLDTVLALGAQLREAWQQATAAPPPALREEPSHVVAVGMGGSAIAADLLAACLAPTLARPVVVVRDGSLPAYVGRHSLVIATSYSGETDETLHAAEAAVRAGAQVAAITSGGRLAALISAHGPVLRVRGGLQPRAAIAYLLAPMLGALVRWQLAAPGDGAVEEAAAVLDAVARDGGPDVPAARNPTKQLAEQLVDRIPVVYAGTPDLGPVARRWKTQFNENSKTFAAWDVFPELTHNEIVGWGLPEELARRIVAVVLLGGLEAASAVRRIRATQDTALGRAAASCEVRARGEGRLARALSLVLLGDLVSVYLAYLRGIDPTPVAAIDAVKRGARGAG